MFVDSFRQIDPKIQYYFGPYNDFGIEKKKLENQMRRQ